MRKWMSSSICVAIEKEFETASKWMSYELSNCSMLMLDGTWGILIQAFISCWMDIWEVYQG